MIAASTPYDLVLERRMWRKSVSGSCRRRGRGTSGPRSTWA